jgi:hypothetical protein
MATQLDDLTLLRYSENDLTIEERKVVEDQIVNDAPRSLSVTKSIRPISTLCGARVIWSHHGVCQRPHSPTDRRHLMPVSL